MNIFTSHLAFVRELNKEKEGKCSVCSTRNRKNKSMQNFMENPGDEDST
jgi:hypothetical protein